MKKLFNTFRNLPRWQTVAFLALLIVLIVEAVLILGNGQSPAIDADQGAQIADTATSTVPVIDVFEVGAEQTGVLTRSGVLASETEIMLAPKIGGRLIDRLVERGDTVAAGQLIARLDQDQALVAAQQNAAVNLGISQSNADRTVIIIEEDKRQAQIQLQNAQTDLVLKQQALESAQIALTNAQNNERNTENQNTQDYTTVVQSTVEALRASQTTADSSLVALSDVVVDVFSGQTQLEVAVRELFFLSQARVAQANTAVNGVSAVSSDTAVLTAINSSITAFEMMRQAFATATTALNDPDIEISKESIGINLASTKLAISQARLGVDAPIRELSSLRDQIRTTQIINQSRTDVAQGTLRSAEIQFSSAQQGVTLATNNVAAAEANIRSIDARLAQQLASAQSQVSIARNQLAAAQAELGKSLVTSPISGVIAEVLADPGALLNPGTPVVKIINPNALKVEVSVSPADAQRIDVTKPVIVNGTQTAFIRGIQPVADAQTRQIIVTIVIDNAGSSFIPESFVEVEIPLQGVATELTIPLKAVVISQDDRQVAAVIDGVIQWKAVTLGENRDTVVVVRDGLEIGDMIVGSSPEFLDEGQQVEISK